jgi:hypothetical protein
LKRLNKLKTEQLKVENLYKKYKEQQNDVFTSERLIPKPEQAWTDGSNYPVKK